MNFSFRQEKGAQDHLQGHRSERGRRKPIRWTQATALRSVHPTGLGHPPLQIGLSIFPAGAVVWSWLREMEGNMASDPTPTPVQQMARADADALLRMEEKIVPEAWQLNRWMLAALLAVNSAGVATIFPASIAQDTKLAACRLFVLGGLAAIASGFALTLELWRLGALTSRAARYWSSVAIDGIRSAADETKIAREARVKSLSSVMPQVLLLASTVLFVWGIAIIP